MKGIIEIKILSVKNMFTNKTTKVDEVISTDNPFKKSVEKVLSKMCVELQKHFKSKNINSEFTYRISND